MKRLFLLTLMFLVLFCSTAIAEIFVSDDGTRLTVSWSPVSDAFYYDLSLNNLTADTVTQEGPVFEPSIIIDGLAYHNIYLIIVSARDTDGNCIESIGQKYITFALDENSGSCVCNCDCPKIPPKVFLGTVSEDWCTGIAINNASSESQVVDLKVGTSIKQIVVPSNSVEVCLLSDLIEEEGSFPISFEAASDKVGVIVLLYEYSSGSFSTQN